jgi:hypothetical protein
MHDHILDEMTDALMNCGAITPAQRAVARAALAACWIERIALVWSLADVHAVAGDLGMAISDDQALAILGTIHEEHDCALGVTWTTIDTELRFLVA